MIGQKKDIYSLYAHINQNNNKVYIGITKSPTKRWWGSGELYSKCPKFYKDIREFGWNTFIHVILYKGLTKEQAEEQEKLWVKALKSVDLSYNIADGGAGASGVKRSDAQKKMLSQLHTGRKHSEITIQRMKDTKKLVRSNGGKVFAFDPYTGILVREYPSINSAASLLQINRNAIIRALTGKQRTTEGYIWSTENHININDSKYKETNGVYKSIYCYDLQGTLVKVFDNALEAAEFIDGRCRSIYGCCRGEAKTYKNYIWRYQEENIPADYLKVSKNRNSNYLQNFN